MSCCQIWQAFVQESIRTIADSADMELLLKCNLANDEVTKEAFSILGENRVIRAPDQHACSECTHDYIETTSDNILTAGSTVVVGVDEDVEQTPQQATDSGSSHSDFTSSDGMDVDRAVVKMVVVDGSCFGPKHCAYEKCLDDLINYGGAGAVLCAVHEQIHGAKCHVFNCDNIKVRGTQACEEHQQQWKKYVAHHKRQSAPGFRIITQRPAEGLPWVSTNEQTEFRLKSLAQITSALIKHAWYPEQLSGMDHGEGYEKRKLNLLLMLIITSTIETLMNFAKNGVILLQLMALHLIWLLKPKIKKEKLVSDVHSIHR